MAECKTCKPDLSERCDPLEEVMHIEANVRTAGVALIVLTNRATDVSRVAGVAARRSARCRAIYFNHCPFCGVKFGVSDSGAHPTGVSG